MRSFINSVQLTLHQEWHQRKFLEVWSKMWGSRGKALWWRSRDSRQSPQEGSGGEALWSHHSLRLMMSQNLWNIYIIMLIIFLFSFLPFLFCLFPFLFSFCFFFLLFLGQGSRSPLPFYMTSHQFYSLFPFLWSAMWPSFVFEYLKCSDFNLGISTRD